MRIIKFAPNGVTPGWAERHAKEVAEARAFVESGERYAEVEANERFSKCTQTQNYYKALRVVLCTTVHDKYRVHSSGGKIYIERLP